MNVRQVFGSVMFFSVAAAFTSFSLGAFSQVTPPGRINYQGVLRDASGNPFNGAVAMTFRFYGDGVGTLLWEETYGPGYVPSQVTVSGGLFSLALGDPAHRSAGAEALFPNVFANHPGITLGVTVGADPEMTPRIQVISAPFALNSDTLDGKHASSFMDASLSGTFLDISSTPQTKIEKLTLNGAVDYGIDASGPTAGGHFQDSNSSGYAYVGNGDYGIDARGNVAGGFFKDLNSTGSAFVGYGDYGVQAGGNTMGGLFYDSNNSGVAYVGYGDDGIIAYGNTTGGYFSGPLSGQAYLGTGDYGIKAYGNYGAGYFENILYGAYAEVGWGYDGINAYGLVKGGGFYDTNSTGLAYVGYSTYKIWGNGAVSFVQNHPTEKDKVIVYAAPEGDEVAVYTRGTAKLVNGEARVKLGETFQWVTNPDIGMTSHLTPKGDCNGLYTESVSTTEMVVRELNGGKSNASFDYLVYGLRIGFEESSIIQEKQQEAYIPSFNDHRERYAKYPELRAFNSLERFKVMESSVRGVPESFLDLSRAKALKDAIHEYAPATDPPVNKLFGYGNGRPEPGTPPSVRPVPGASSPVALVQRPTVDTSIVEPARGEISSAAVLEPKPTFPCLPFSDSVEPADVVVMDPANEKHVVRCAVAADPMVVGIAAGRGSECSKFGQVEQSPQVPVATSGIVPCKVDAAFGPIRRGDLLVASPNPGHAMRAVEPTPGTVLGKALEPLATGTGLIKVLVMLR